MQWYRWPATTLIVLGLAACGSAARDRAGSAEVPPAAEASREAGMADWESLVPNPRRPEDGVLSGGQPTLEQLEELREAGFRTVINLRTAGEPGPRAAEVEALGLNYVELPIRGAEGLTEANARAFSTALDEAQRPVLVHCASGNRVGALFALEAFYVDGLGAEEAMKVGENSGLTRLADAVRQHLESASQR